MQPIHIATGFNAALKAAELFTKVTAIWEEAGKVQLADAQYYGAWINLASWAIKGLEQEYIEILIEADFCQLNDPEQKKALLMRIEKYIKKEFFRLALQDAIKHLREGRKLLEKHADQWLFFPNVKKSAALDRYDKLLNDLTDYLGRLGDYGGDSAVALKDLYDIQALAHSGSPDAFKQKVDGLRKNLNKATLMQITGECAEVMETLRTGFR